MKPKTLLIVVLLLAVLSAAAWFLNRPEPPPSLSDARVGRPLLDASAAEKVARIRLSEQGKTVVLARDSASGAWQVSSAHDLPVDFPKLAAFVKSLNTTSVERLVTASPDRIARLDFSDTRIALLDTSGQPLLDLSLGKLAETGGGRFLRFGDENKAYLARLTAWLDLDSANWTDKTLARFAPADIAQITIAFSGSPAVTATRPDARAPFSVEPTPEGKRLKSDTLTTLLSTLSNLRFSDTTATDASQAVGAREAARVVTLVTLEGKTLTFALGRQPERTVARKDALKASPQLFLAGATTPEPTAILGPVTEKLPAGPAFVFITHSDAANPVNALMAKRAFQVADHALNSLPADAAALFENIPPPAPATNTP